MPEQEQDTNDTVDLFDENVEDIFDENALLESMDENGEIVDLTSAEADEFYNRITAESREDALSNPKLKGIFKFKRRGTQRYAEGEFRAKS